MNKIKSSKTDGKNKYKYLEKLSLKFTGWIGTPESILIHTVFFAGAFFFVLAGVNINLVLLVLTTLVSLEAIYLALFIQMTVNRASESLEDIEEDVDEIQEDVKELEENVDDIEEDVGEITEDIDKLQEDEEKEFVAGEKHLTQEMQTYNQIEKQLFKLTHDMGTLQKEIKLLRSVYRNQNKTE